jgi:hypothetical protein
MLPRMGALGTAKRPRRFIAALAVWLAAFLSTDCAVTGAARDTVAGWFGAEPKPPRACYARVAHAKLREGPDPSSRIVGDLALHEGVLAYQTDADFTFVRTEKGGRSGWIRVGDLIDRLPAPPSPEVSAPAAEPEPPPQPEPAQPDEPRERSVFDPY